MKLQSRYALISAILISMFGVGFFGYSVLASYMGNSVSLSTTIAGERINTDRLLTAGSFTSTNITTNATTTVITGAGILRSITINTPAASQIITIYDSTAGSGNKIGTITLPATLLQQGPYTATYDVSFSTGLVLTTSSTAGSTGTSDITVSAIQGND